MFRIDGKIKISGAENKKKDYHIGKVQPADKRLLAADITSLEERQNTLNKIQTVF